MSDDLIQSKYVTRKVGTFRLRVPTDANNIGMFVNETADAILTLADEDWTAEDIVGHLLHRYPDVDAVTMRRDVCALLERYAARSVSSHKVYLAGDAMETKLREQAAQLRVPIDGTFELTFRCNLRCIHCYCVHCKFPRAEMTLSECCVILDSAAEAGCIWILLTGGEPLMRPDFLDIYRHARGNGMIVTVFSNGLRMDRYLCEALVKQPPFLLELSMYGASDKTYRAITGARNGFKKFRAVCDMLDSYGLNYALKTVVLQQNVGELKQMEEFALSRKKRFRFDAELLGRLDGTSAPEGVALNHADAIRAEFGERPTEYAAWIQGCEQRRKKYNQGLFYCNGGKTAFNIDPFGRMSLCGQVRVPSFSLRERPFAESWGELNMSSEKPLPTGFRCARCDLIEFCRACPSALFVSKEQCEVLHCGRALARRDASSTWLNVSSKGEER